MIRGQLPSSECVREAPCKSQCTAKRARYQDTGELWDCRLGARPRFSADSPPTETTHPFRARSGGGWRATSRAAARRAAPSSSRTDRCRSAAPVCRALAARRCALLVVARAGRRSRRPAPRAAGAGTISASTSVGQHIQQAVGVGRDDRLPHRQRFERRQRRAFPQRRKHHEVERGQRRGDVALEPEEAPGGRRGRARAACASSSPCSSPSPTM